MPPAVLAEYAAILQKTAGQGKAVIVRRMRTLSAPLQARSYCSVKKTDLEKLKGVSINSRMAGTATPGRFGKDAQMAFNRREQRKQDQAKGLVPFAVKLDAALVKAVQTLAAERKADLGTVVTELLNKGLAA